MANPELERLIACALDEQAKSSERQNAFGKLVMQFQQAAYRCAYGRIGNEQVAQDMVQEAFITAYQHLHQLRSPAAFSSWLRRIVVSRCNQVMRDKEALFLSIDEMPEMPDPAWTPDADDFKHEILAAIATLPEHERLVTSLFYLDGYSQREVAHALDVPESTVNNRLHASRQRLKGRMGHMVRTGQNKQNITIRPFTDYDWQVLRDIIGTMGDDGTMADDSAQLDQWLDYRRQFDENSRIRRHYIVEDIRTHDAIGYGSIEQQGPDPHWFRLYICGSKSLADRDTGEPLYARLLEDCRSLAAVGLWIREWEYYIDELDFARNHGFVETDRVAGLYLPVEDTAIARLQKDETRTNGRDIDIITLEEARRNDPDYLVRLADFWNCQKPNAPSPYRDVPKITMPITPEFIAERLSHPDVNPTSYFIAREKDGYIGLNALKKPYGKERRRALCQLTVRHDLDRTDQEIGPALLHRTVSWAGQHDYQIIETYVNTRTPWRMASFTKMGFRRRDLIYLEKTPVF